MRNHLVFSLFDDVVDQLEDAIKSRSREITMITAAEDFMREVEEYLRYVSELQ